MKFSSLSALFFLIAILSFHGYCSATSTHRSLKMSRMSEAGGPADTQQTNSTSTGNEHPRSQVEIIAIQETVNSNTRALYLFVFACLTVIFCCVGLQFILNNAKESKKYLTTLEKRRQQRLQAEAKQASETIAIH